MTSIQQASQQNKYLYIFFYKDLNDRTLHLQEIFDQTEKKLGDKARFVKISIKDPKENQIVDKFDIKRAPMPLALVIAPNGAVTGGYFSSFTEEHLLSSFSSPATACCLKALQDKKLVFLCVQNDQTKANEVALKGVTDFKADPRFANATEIVMIDPTDVQEKTFLSQFGINSKDTQALTIFLSPPGETIGVYKGSTNKERCISDLQAATSGSCGPEGCPGGCCPGGRCK